MSKLSEGYYQLGGIFKSLEDARFRPDTDFGANVTGCFSWYLSPDAAVFLEKREIQAWVELKKNQQFKWNFQQWSGHSGEGVDIKLNL